MSNSTEWFEPLYARANRDASAVPWAGMEPMPQLVSWLDQLDGGVDGLTALVVGCGLGDDAAELARRGAIVTAFDVSATAVQWARERFGELGIDFVVADLFDLPAGWARSFDVVVEVRTIQSLPPSVRAPASAAVGRCVGPQGLLVVVALLATSQAAREAAGGPPWPLAPAELADFRVDGLDRLELAHPRDSGAAMDVVATFARSA